MSIADIYGAIHIIYGVNALSAVGLGWNMLVELVACVTVLVFRGLVIFSIRVLIEYSTAIHLICKGHILGLAKRGSNMAKLRKFDRWQSPR